MDYAKDAVALGQHSHYVDTDRAVIGQCVAGTASECAGACFMPNKY